MKNEEKPRPTEMDFHYVKISSYRVHHVDGIFGGLTPRRNIHAEIFVERKPTPTRIRFAVEESGELGDEIEREGKNGFVREIECGLVMDIHTAKSFRDWLDSKIQELEKIFPEEDDES